MAKRIPEYKVNDIFINRWSPRAMSGEEISDQELMSLFEAARWAPSSYNNQPWRFVYAQRNSSAWDTIYGLMVEANQQWAKNAAVLMVIFSRDNFTYNEKPARTHSFDTGSAWMSLALQGSLMGLVVHGMEGFDYDRAKKVLNIPDGYTVEAMCAVGKPGKTEDLPKEMQKNEFPSDRKPVSSFAFEGTFKK